MLGNFLNLKDFNKEKRACIKTTKLATKKTIIKSLMITIKNISKETLKIFKAAILNIPNKKDPELHRLIYFLDLNTMTMIVLKKIKIIVNSKKIITIILKKKY